MRGSRNGQSTLEYVIILAAVVGAIIAIGAALKTKMSSSFGTLTNTMGDKVSSVSFGGNTTGNRT